MMCVIYRRRKRVSIEHQQDSATIMTTKICRRNKKATIVLPPGSTTIMTKIYRWRSKATTELQHD